jgi:uncharacterized integral membrane protein
MYEGPDRSDRDDGVGRARSGLSPALVAAGVIAIVLIIFILQNSNRASVEFLFFERQTPVWVAIGIGIVLGVILDRLVTVWWRRTRRRRDER